MTDPEQRAASWWEAAKSWCREASWNAYVAQKLRNDALDDNMRLGRETTRADAAETKLAKIHEILEHGHTGLTTIARIRSVVEAE